VVLGAAFQLLPELSIGAAVSLGLASAASSHDYIQDATNYSTLLLDNHVTTTVNLSPTVGVRWRPVQWLRIGGTVHAPESFTLDTSVDAALPTGTESSTTQTNVFDWMPWSVSIGAEAVLVRRGAYTMSVVGSFDYAFWSSYVDRQGDSPSMYGPELAWHDTASGAIGVRHTYRDARAFIDMRYVPSPVPEQIGRSNYVDNDRVGLGVGGDIALHLPKVLRPGIQLFVDRLVPRTNEKTPSLLVDELPDGAVFGSTLTPVPGAHGLQTNNPGWPGFSSGGWLWGGSVTLSIPL
jgi:long-chain fatty acid transport protein